MEAKKVYQQWCEDTYFDEETRRELIAIREDEDEIEERFYRELAFGTGGLRGILGAGTNRMNIYTVRKATQGLANFIIKEHGQDKGVAIAYDSRNYSQEFAVEAALCLAANGIKAYVIPFARRRSSPLPCAIWDVYPVLSSRQAITRLSTTDTRYTGRMVRRLQRRRTHRLSVRLMRLAIMRMCA